MSTPTSRGQAAARRARWEGWPQVHVSVCGFPSTATRRTQTHDTASQTSRAHMRMALERSVGQRAVGRVYHPSRAAQSVHIRGSL